MTCPELGRPRVRNGFGVGGRGASSAARNNPLQQLLSSSLWEILTRCIVGQRRVWVCAASTHCGMQW